MEKLKRTGALIFIIAAVLLLSRISSTMWGGKPEKISTLTRLELAEGMTVREFAARNGLPESVARNVFGMHNSESLDREIESFGFHKPELLGKTNRSLALFQEHESKNWVKIPVKFALWIAFLAAVFVLLRKKKISAGRRIALYGSAVLVFGIILGADPSPMGTVKDAIVLFGKSRAVFPPRMIALGVFILLTVAANKFICSWGCQFGTLQDLVFRINRNRKDTTGLFRQIKIPFFISNGVRIIFFLIFSAAAIVYAFDIVEQIDPFKIFNPKMIGIAGAVFISAIIVSGLFVYRPWCHLFCPFGLVSWLFEKLGFYKIQVDYATCIACEKCAKACPSNVMSVILKRNGVIPDCFSCGTCINVCPTGSISIRAGKRAMPPENKFSKRTA
ncbi:MAG: 4Fe-4S binding protein [Spirochaetes bacterium]|nr:4Fe-4S binding protein [Spirochaetota bacterium]